MIIQIENQLSPNKKLIASWRIHVSKDKEASTLDFIAKLMNTYEVKWILNSTNNINQSYDLELQAETQYLFMLIGKPYNFYSIQNRMTEYFSVMNAEVLIA